MIKNYVFSVIGETPSNKGTINSSSVFKAMINDSSKHFILIVDRATVKVYNRRKPSDVGGVDFF